MKLTGSCHCGQVRYEVQVETLKVIDCNCSICTKRGALHLRVPAEAFGLKSGGAALKAYRFGTFTAKHWFCERCGIPVYSNPRIAPDKVNVNARTLDRFHELDFERVLFDGQHWEDAALQAGWKPTSQED